MWLAVDPRGRAPLHGAMAALILAFLGTNIDGGLCLAAAFAVDPPRRRLRAIFASTLGFVVLLCISVAGSLAIGRLTIDVAWFGIVPATVGIVRLTRIILGLKSDDRPAWLSSGHSIFSIVLATGADNVAVYTPLFALRTLGVTWVVAAVYLLCWVLGTSILTYTTPSLQRVEALQRYLEPAVAVLFIVMGLAIVVRS